MFYVMQVEMYLRCGDSREGMSCWWETLSTAGVSILVAAVSSTRLSSNPVTLMPGGRGYMYMHVQV